MKPKHFSQSRRLIQESKMTQIWPNPRTQNSRMVKGFTGSFKVDTLESMRSYITIDVL